MASIPLPALDVKPPQPNDSLGAYQKLMALRSLGQQQQIQQQTIQSNQQEQQIRQQQIVDEQATTAAMKSTDPTSPTYFDDLTKSALQNGASAARAQLIQQHGLTIKKTVSDIAAQDATTGSKNLETFIGKHKAVGDALEGIENVPDDQLHAAATQKITELTKAGILDPQTAQQALQGVQSTADPQALRQHIDVLAKSSMGMKAVAEQAKTQAETNQANAKARLDDAEALQKGSPLLRMELSPAEMAGDKLPAAIGYLQTKISDPTTDPKDVARATRLLSTAKMTQQTQLAMEASKKATEQAIQDGDPVAAGKLLHDGVVSPSQIVSSRKPEFAQKAFTAAASYGDNWNAQKAEADFKVASSPGNVAFFGSAKSLTDKGGTLDQLKDAAKDIPDGQIPAFNSIADVMRAATGSGPIAKYSSILLGVADDYSKVMGGGQGSDTSRTQALSLVPAKASPEARAAAIEGIRGSVGSQINSRIGSNPVLKQMYGSQMSGGGASSAASQAETRTYQGHTYAKQSDGSWKLTQ